MTTSNHSDSSMPSALELANPQFRFPVRAVPSIDPTSTPKAENRSIKRCEVPGEEPTQTIIHAPHSANSTNSHTPHQADRYVGWSIQDVSWINNLEADSQRPVASPVAEQSSPSEAVLPPTLPAKQAKQEATTEEAFTVEGHVSTTTRPLDLNVISEAPVDPARHWSTSSRSQVTGFAIQRTRISQPQTIVSGAGLASGHRRWAARNHSAELQARTVGLEIPVQAAESTASVIRDSESHLVQGPAAKKNGNLSGGLPLVVHPDFRWSPVVEQLAAGGAFAEQLLTAAEQLLQEGQGRLLFASAQRQQGATTLAATTARMLIDRGRRVLMVDADLGHAGWTSSLELHSAGSWVEQVEAFEPLQAAMAISRRTSSAFVGLHPVGSRRELPSFLLDYLGQLLVPFKGQFDATIIDVGPISQLLEELSQPARLGTAVMVVQQGGTDAAIELRRNKTTLNAFGISRLAIARNFAA